MCVENAGDGTFAVVIAGLQTFPVKVEGGEFVFPQDPSIQGQVSRVEGGVDARFIWFCPRMGVFPMIKLLPDLLFFSRIEDTEIVGAKTEGGKFPGGGSPYSVYVEEESLSLCTHEIISSEVRVLGAISHTASIPRVVNFILCLHLQSLF